MIKKSLCVLLCITIISMLFPVSAIAQTSLTSQTSTNYAAGKPYTFSGQYQSNFGNPNTIVTDGNKYSSTYVTVYGSPSSIKIDLKGTYTIDKIKVWHYWADGRTYHNTKTEVSEDGLNWTTIFDSAVSGEYKETEHGKIHTFNALKVRYIRDWINGSNVNNGNQWVEIQAFGPGQVGNDVKQNLPFNDGLESTSGVAGLPQGTVSLTQDKVSGTYAVKVAVGDNSNDNYFSYKLTTSTPFEISMYSQIKIWVKPGAGAKWIRFWNVYDSNVLGFVKNDKDGDGLFKVGEDLVSGKWNLVTLDLTRTSNPSMVEGKELWVHTNEFSTWSYDDITSVYAPVSSVDISKMFNNQTQLVNGGLQFKPNGTTTYNTTPTVLVSNTLQSTFSRASIAYKKDGVQVATDQPRYETGRFGQALMMEEGTTNLLSANQSSVETDLTGFFSINGGVISRDTTQYMSGAASLKIVTPGAVEAEGAYLDYVAASPGVAYTGSVYLKGTNGTARMCFAAYTSAGAFIAWSPNSNIVTLNGTWQRAVLTWTPPANTARLYMYVLTQNGAPQAITFYADCMQIEQKAYATSWVLGGTARSAESLAIPTAGVFTKGNWAVEMTFSPTSKQDITGRFGHLWTLAIDSNNWYRIGITATGQLQISVASGGVEKGFSTSLNPVISVGSNYSIMFSGDGTNIRACVNGVQVGSDLPYTEPVGTLPSFMYVGSDSSGANQCNGLIDDLRFSSRARTVTEHQSAYNSGQLLLIDQYTTCKMDMDGNLTVGTGNFTSTLPDGKISKISINSSYTTSSGPLNTLPSQRLYLPGVHPTKFALSGDGNRLYYGNPQDLGKIYLLDLITGENRKISEFSPTNIDLKANFDGTKAAFKVYNNLYLYDNLTGVTTFINTNVTDFEIQKDGTVYYIYSDVGNQIIYSYISLTAAPGIPCVYRPGIVAPGIISLDVPKAGKQIFYSYSDSAVSSNGLQCLTFKNDSWGDRLLTKTSKRVDGLWTNFDGTAVFFQTADGFFSYQISSKALRKLDIPTTSVVKEVTDNNELIILDSYDYSYQVYDPDTDKLKDIRPSDAKNPGLLSNDCGLDIDNAGNKMAYVSTNGLSTYYFNGVQRPERYLLSFDGKNSWYSYKNGVWSVVKTGSVPVAADFDKYGMTIDEVNALDEGDFESLYQNGRQILHLDVAVYFASVDPYITPSLKGITATIKGTGSSGGAPGDTLLEKALYAKKQQDFNATTWRQIKKIYPVELFPKEAEIYYFVYTDRGNYSFKNKQWTAVDSQLLTNMEANWIAISQQGITAEDLKTIPEDSLNSLLPTDNFSIVYAMKVQDLSTEGYISLITVDYVESQFVSNNLVLKLTLTDGTVKQYPNLTKTEVEDFMNWLNERQYNRGPIFYCIKTGSTTPGVVQVNGYINYYMIQSVDVEEMT